jgi:hypothetical protein
MTQISPSASRSPVSRGLRWLLGLLIGSAVAFYIWQQLPGAGYPTDMTRVGAGVPTLVLAHDSGYVGGSEVMERMNGLRADYAGRVDFLVAHLRMADGAAFAQRHGARDGTVLLFSADGRKVGVLHLPNVDELRQALDHTLGG